MGNKKNKNKKNRRKKDQMILGYNMSLLQKQAKVKAGDAFICPRCGEQHRYADGRHEFPEARDGDVLLYRCGERVLIGGVKGYTVVHIENKLSRNHRMTSALLDFVSIMTPIAGMATDQERLANTKSMIMTGKEVIPIRIPLASAKHIRYAVMMAIEVLEEQGFLSFTEESKKVMFDPEQPNFATTSLLSVPTLDPTKEDA